MTILQNVAVAVERVDRSLRELEVSRSSWQTIRAHLMSQEAEIDELVRALTMCTDRAKRAESRLAAANALLRECQMTVMSLHPATHARIQSHLQGAR